MNEHYYDSLLGNNDIFIASRSTINISLSIYYCGSEDFKSNAIWGPKVVDHFILYYVYEGRGVLTVGGKNYQLEKGDGFLVPKDVLTSFKADIAMPMKVAWVGFYGYLADKYIKRCHLSEQHPIFTYNQDEFFKNAYRDMIQLSKRKYNRYCAMIAILYNMIGKLIDMANDNRVRIYDEDSVELYLRQALEYIDMNYSKKMSIQDVADYIKIDRKYLHKIFKSHIEESPQEYLINYRIDKACKLIENTDLPISSVSMSVGYDDMFHFSKMFKKITGVPPSVYRINNTKIQANFESQDTQTDAIPMIIEHKDEVIKELKEIIKELKDVINLKEK